MTSEKMSKAKTSVSEDAAAGGTRVSSVSIPRRRVSVRFPAETLTEQSHKAACDVNNIMARYTLTGVMEHVRRFEPVYADVSAADYKASMDAISAAKTLFEELPSRVRRHFGDDVTQFLAYCDETPDAASGLQAIAEEYRKQALGLDQAQKGDVAGREEVAHQSGRDAGPAKAQDGAKDGPGEGEGAKAPA